MVPARSDNISPFVNMPRDCTSIKTRHIIDVSVTLCHAVKDVYSPTFVPINRDHFSKILL